MSIPVLYEVDTIFDAPKRWIKEGERLVKLIERESFDEDLDEVTEVIEDSVHQLRTKTLELI